MASSEPKTFVTAQQAVMHALFRKHRSMSVVARLLGLSQIRVREGLVQHQRNQMRDDGIKPPPLKEMLRGDVVTRFGVSRHESGGRPAKHIQLGDPTSATPQKGSNRGVDGQTFAVPVAGVQRLIVTAVEPDAPIHEGFWQNLKAYAAARNARLLVVRTGNVATRADLAADYASHVVNAPMSIGCLLELSVDDMPAARLARPLEGFRGRNAARWTIVPHGAVQLETLPRSEGLRVQLTTGSMSMSRSAGARHRHELGAVIAEITSAGSVHCRHLLAPAEGDGTFQDLDDTVSQALSGQASGSRR